MLFSAKFVEETYESNLDEDEDEKKEKEGGPKSWSHWRCQKIVNHVNNEMKGAQILKVKVLS